MSDKSNALDYIAHLFKINASQLPSLDPEDFHVSDWPYLEYATATDVRGSMCDKWSKLGVSVKCPSCGRYATEVFFVSRSDRLPSIFFCGYERKLWNSSAPDWRMKQVATQMKVKYDEYDAEDRENRKSDATARTYR
jgi:hypothetical protein